MRRGAGPRAASMLGGCALALAGAASAATAQDAASVDAVFAGWSGATPGCAVSVERPGEATIARVYGLAELEHRIPATSETIYEAGSVSKQFTGAAILLLVDDGTLSLDDDVRRWLPELPDYGRVITIRHMLNHTSGLRDWGAIASLEGWPRGTRAVGQEQVLEIVARQKALNFEPGSQWLYSNSGFNLAALVVARASGKSFAEFTRERLFEPLGMSRTRWRDDFTAVVPDRAQAYAPERDGYHLAMPFENAHGNGGLLTTVGDLQIWNRALTRNRLNLATRLAERGMAGGHRTHYGLGLETNAFEGQVEIGHAGSTGGYRAWLARYPAQGLSIALLCNAAEANPEMLGRQVADLFLPDPPAETPYVPRAPAPEGLYASSRTGEPFGLRATPGGVIAIPGGRPLAPIGPDRWRLGEDELRFVSADRFIRSTVDGDEVAYDRRDPWSPDAAALEAFAGTYVSDEVPARWTLAVAGDRLTVDGPGRPPAPMTPAYQDVFASPPGLVRFERDASGAVTALRIDAGRARDIVFRRLP